MVIAEWLILRVTQEVRAERTSISDKNIDTDWVLKKG